MVHLECESRMSSTAPTELLHIHQLILSYPMRSDRQGAHQRQLVWRGGDVRGARAARGPGLPGVRQAGGGAGQGAHEPARHQGALEQ